MNSQTHGNSFFFCSTEKLIEKGQVFIPLYMFTSSRQSHLLVQPGDPTDAFASCQRRHFLQCQIGSRHKPLSWLLHLLYIFITSLFSSCPAPTHTHTHTHKERKHPPTYTQMCRTNMCTHGEPCTHTDMQTARENIFIMSSLNKLVIFV